MCSILRQRMVLPYYGLVQRFRERRERLKNSLGHKWRVRGQFLNRFDVNIATAPCLDCARSVRTATLKTVRNATRMLSPGNAVRVSPMPVKTDFCIRPLSQVPTLLILSWNSGGKERGLQSKINGCCLILSTHQHNSHLDEQVPLSKKFRAFVPGCFLRWAFFPWRRSEARHVSMPRSRALWRFQPGRQNCSPCPLNVKVTLEIREMQVLQCLQTHGHVALCLRFFKHLPVFSSSPFWGRNPASSQKSRQSVVLADEMDSTTRGALGVSRTCSLLFFGRQQQTSTKCARHWEFTVSKSYYIKRVPNVKTYLIP